ncbi:MAG: hypothetical protein HeimC3_35970 [Candidatus Heimdallarchaeota archaeon LC_3]|nr:MAG: hypothetical protein HeimC3_35970 [Candidatus Heimdallarchaeota archaeon LC_3]
MEELTIGSKGELFLPKHLRDSLKLKPGDKVFFEIGSDLIKIYKSPDLLELLDLPPLTKPISPKEIESELEKFQEEQINYSIKETD